MLRTNARPPSPDERRLTKGDHVIKWIETHCVGTVGAWAKKPARLMRWQKAFIRNLFSVDSSTGRRVYRWVLLGLPKKNGKTELAAWLALYLLIGDGEPAPWIAVSAAADKQADLVFGAAKRCAEWSPTLRLICETFDKEILVPSIPGAKLVRVAASAGTNDGPSWHAVIIDEYHEWVGKKLEDNWNILTNGVGARSQPLIIQITTAGYDIDSSLCGRNYKFGLQLEEDPSLDPRFLFWWYEADLRGDRDWKDPAVWEDANPSWGNTLPDPMAYLLDQLNRKTESVFKRYFLDIWTDAEDMWLPDGAWDARAVEPWGDYEADEFAGFSPDQPLYVGIDGGLKRDAFAVVASQWAEDKLRVRAWVWENPYPDGHPSRSEWKLALSDPAGLLRRMRMAFPRPALKDADDDEVPGPGFAYDPFMLEFMAGELADERLNMVETPQTDSRMMPASETLFRLVMEGTLEHDGDPVLRRHVYASVQKPKDRGWRLTRPAGTRRANDAGIAMAMSVAMAVNALRVEDEPDIY